MVSSQPAAAGRPGLNPGFQLSAAGDYRTGTSSPGTFSCSVKYEPAKSFYLITLLSADPEEHMRLKNLPFWSLCLAASLQAVPISSLPACASGQSLLYYQTNYPAGSGGCAIGELSVSDFTFSRSTSPNPVTGATLLASAADILIQPQASLIQTLRFDSSKFVVDAGNRVVYRFGYIIDPPPEIIPGFDAEIFASSPVFPGTARLRILLCAAGAVSPFEPDGCDGGTAYSFELFHDGFSCVSCQGGVIFDRPVSFVGVFQELILDATAGGSSQIDGIGGRLPYIVPEPSTYAMLGTGLGGLLFWARRRRS
jgi:hypothetical protein